jgi:hypothetical protein
MAMAEIELQDGVIEVDAAIIGKGLGIEPAQVHALMRQGAITSLCERGTGEDAGRYRLTFFHRGRRLRLVVDETGRLIQRSAVDFGRQPLPPALRRPGG